ncbi:MAG TPA: pyridoxal-phosphate dependent enzyme [Edaphocola sp.]|nr:pyridoxal-phosphate dependent enzyme [Edaphocola sp.]
MAIDLNFNIKCSRISLDAFSQNNCKLSLLRLDEIHPIVSGNKWFKLKYYIEAYQNGKYSGILTFGGAYSNHLAATAAACNYYQIPVEAIVRGRDGMAYPSQTLKDCGALGMQFQFVNRAQYKLYKEEEYINTLREQFPNFLIIPEGGYGSLGVKGAALIHQYLPDDTDVVAAAVGSSTTICGLLEASKKEQEVIGFTALKQGEYLLKELKLYNKFNNGRLITEYHFGGFGKYKPELINFMKQFKQEQNIELDFVYTAKMMFGLFDLIGKGNFKNKNIVAIHSGGLQGNQSIQYLL